MNKKKTGIDMLDNLSPEDRELAIENSTKHWQSLTPEQKVMHLDLYYAMLRQKQREHGGMITNIDAANEFFSKIYLLRRRRRLKKQSSMEGLT
jgi:hypothetical protein